MLRFFDSCGDNYTAGQASRYWTAVGVGPTVTAAGGRHSSNCLRLDSGSAGVDNYLGFTMPAAHATGIVGIALKPETVTTGYAFLHVRSGGTLHLYVIFDASGHLQVYRGDGTLLATGTTVIPTSGFTYIEMKWTIHDSTGAVEVRLNGLGSAECSATNVDTRNGAVASFDNIRIFGRNGFGNGNTINIDDVYLCDGTASGITGAPNDDFLGDVRVDYQPPVTDAVSAGTHADFTPSTGSDHGALVDETTANDDTDYNASSTPGDIDSYKHAALATTPTTIFGVMPVPVARKTDAGARTIAPLVRSDGTDYPGTAVAPTTSYAVISQIWEADPDTGVAWVKSGLDAAETALKVVT